MLRNSDLTQCEQFVYLGGVISEDLSCDSKDRFISRYSTGIFIKYGRQTTSASQQK